MGDAGAGALVLPHPAAPPVPEPPALHGALLDSRQRWRELVLLATDFAFETDAWGRFVFVSPDPALGWPAATLLGQAAELLLVEAGGATCFNPFRPASQVRRRRAWLKRPDGGSVCLSFAAAPIVGPDGRFAGARGAGIDMSEQERRESEVAGALRRGEVLDHILWRMRKQVEAPLMIQAALDALGHATGAEGLALLDGRGSARTPATLYGSGRQVVPAITVAMEVLHANPEDGGQGGTADGRIVLVCPPGPPSGFAANGVLALWRERGSRAWDSDERTLANATAAILRVILEHDAAQSEMRRLARTDPLTGLLNRRAFFELIGRRIDRLDVDGLPGTLMFVDLDHFKALNDSRGHDAGDEALRRIASLLQGTVRPSDLVARLGGDEFALWLDGADELAAAERAEQLRVSGPEAVAHLMPDGIARITLSIGIATRWPGNAESVDALMERADQVMYEVKRGGRGAWRVAQAGPPA